MLKFCLCTVQSLVRVPQEHYPFLGSLVWARKAFCRSLEQKKNCLLLFLLKVCKIAICPVFQMIICQQLIVAIDRVFYEKKTLCLQKRRKCTQKWANEWNITDYAIKEKERGKYMEKCTGRYMMLIISLLYRYTYILITCNLLLWTVFGLNWSKI